MLAVLAVPVLAVLAAPVPAVPVVAPAPPPVPLTAHTVAVMEATVVVEAAAADQLAAAGLPEEAAPQAVAGGTNARRMDPLAAGLDALLMEEVATMAAGTAVEMDQPSLTE